ncbi:alpha-hydroxy acid oxidase [Streptomyces sp. OE57]|uniref:alpha-hydroxy acid oxidase n=1 Tax=Streptomyces lacaronensis TaxID=3379885 RepID=UPI0039B72A2E
MSAEAEGIDLDHVYEVAEFQKLAEERMPDVVRSFVNCDGGGITLRQNVEAWQQWSLRNRALVDVSALDTATTVLGDPVALPVLIAPFCCSTFCHPDAELGLAVASARARTVFTLSMAATRTPEEIGSAAGRFWMQLYWPKDRGVLKDVVHRAAAAGATALCLTVDLPVTPSFPPGMRRAAASLAPQSSTGEHASFVSRDYGQRFGVDTVIDPRISWKDLEWLAGLTSLPLVLKGVTTATDARLAAEHGAAGVIVSNHGGHGLDRSVATADVLSDVVEGADGRIEVFVDGGIRTGTDVLCALALGARAVLVGRPAMWGLTIGGADGATRVLTVLREELGVAMAVTGATRISEISPAILRSRWPERLDLA